MKICAPIAMLMFATTVLAQDRDPYDVAAEAIKVIDADNKKQHTGNADVLVMDNLIADRKAKRVEILACMTGLPESEPLEFFLASNKSGKAYEAMAVTWAIPSDIHKGLEFIGLKPGRPVNFEKNQQWPRGPRVVMTFQVGDKRIRAEELVIEHDKPMKTTGFVFGGSFRHTDDQGVSHYAADVTDSQTIAADYNDPVAVLDLPRRVSQSAVYGFQRPNPAFTFTKGQLARVILEPATGDSAVGERNLVINTSVRTKSIRYEIAGTDPPTVSNTLPELVDNISKLVDGKTDLFTRVTINDAMRIDDVRKLYTVLMAMEKDAGVKLEPPEGANLFHRAFFPDESWRRREDRLGEPWELFLARMDGKIAARLERVMEKSEPQPHKEVQRFDPATPEEFVKLISENQSQWTRAIFVYPPDDLTYGELMNWTRGALPGYPRIFVFPASQQ